MEPTHTGIASTPPTAHPETHMLADMHAALSARALAHQANDLVAENFYSASDNLLLDAVSFNSYRVRSAGQTLGLHMGPSRSHATILALLNGPGQQQQHAAAEVSWSASCAVAGYWACSAAPVVLHNSLLPAAQCSKWVVVVLKALQAPHQQRKGLTLTFAWCRLARLASFVHRAIAASDALPMHACAPAVVCCSVPWVWSM